MKQPRHITALAVLLFSLLILASLLAGTSASAQDGPTPTPGLPAPTSAPDADRVQQVIDNANATIELANSMMSFIQTMMAVLTAIAAVAGIGLGVLGVRNFRVSNETLSKANEALDKLNIERARLETETQQRLRDLEALKLSVAAETKQQIEAATGGLQEFGENAVRALTLLQLGKQQFDARNLDAALNTLMEALNYAPDNQAINYYLGELYLQMDNRNGELEKGIEHLKRASAESETLTPAIIPAKAAYAYALRRKGDAEPDRAEQTRLYNRAEHYFLQALNANPNLLDIEGESHQGAYGNLLRKRGNNEDAIYRYEQAIKATGGRSSYPFVNIGILNRVLAQGSTADRQEREKQAAQAFEDAVKVARQRIDDSPRDFWAQCDLVTAAAALGKADLVQKHLPMALQYPPDASKLEKFVRELKRLQSASPSQLLDVVIKAAEGEMNKRRHSGGPEAARSSA